MRSAKWPGRCGAWLVLAALAGVAACNLPRGPVAAPGNAPEDVGGTIAGTVRIGGEALPARRVTAINEATGARYEVATGTNGGYTLKVPAGTYRLELELRSGETLDTRPERTEVNVGDLDPDRNFVVAVR